MMRGSLILLSSLIFLLLEGCVPVAMVSGAATATAVFGERRGSSGFLEDNWVAVKIRNTYLQSNKVSAGNVNVSVYRGKVLLTGVAASEEEITEAKRIAQETQGVNKVISELKVQYASASDIALDILISNKVKMKLLTDRDVRGLDFHVETTKGVVYIIGMARTIGERDAAVKIASEVAKVKQVVSYIDIDPKAYPVNPDASEETPAPQISKNRNASDILEDNWVAMKIRGAYVQSDIVHVGNIDVSVYLGQVLLTGTASSEKEIAEAIRIAKNTMGVWEVISELKVEQVTTSDLAADAWLTNKVKVALLADQIASGLGIHVQTTKKVVYLTGVTATIMERDRALEVARNVSGVEKVVSYVDIEADAQRKK
ncbi:MAG: BON domain-containing protein [Magnetococcales bacterium]|nr:BON domain-containing protein [Magnetococcales bacterium]MBF0323281.1 BON domain-containing protein [Magnetococcales bacterium]